MKTIPSFTIDHTKLLRGIYVSRKDLMPSGEVITTFDVRMTEPNRQPAIAPEALHTIEHLAATFLRNHEEWKERVIYWGPMGCCTGNYLILRGNLESRDVVELIRQTMSFIAGFDGEIPGASPVECGNYTFMNLAEARVQARRYLEEVLENISSANLEYP